MIVPFAGDLMARLCYTANKLRELIGDPSKDEKGRLCLVFFKQFQGSSRIVLESRLEAIPLPALDELIECTDLEVVLQSHREHVPAHRRDYGRSRLRQ